MFEKKPGLRVNEHMTRNVSIKDTASFGPLQSVQNDLFMQMIEEEEAKEPRQPTL